MDSNINKLLNQYLDFNFNDLKWFSPNRGFGSPDYVQFYNESGKILMDGIIGKELIVSQQLYNDTVAMFSITMKEFDDTIRNWCRDSWNLNFPKIYIDDTDESMGYINESNKK